MAMALIVSCGTNDGGPQDADTSESSTSQDDPTSSASSSPATSGATTTTAGNTTSATTTSGTTSSTGGPPGVEGAGSVEFFGNGGLYGDRVLIPVDDPSNDDPGPPVDVGANEFTIEFWIHPDPAGNPNPAITCGDNYDFVTTNIVVDRDRHSQGRAYGVGIAGGLIVFAINADAGARTLCGQTRVDDDAWHHVAVQRRASDGQMWLFVDGQLEGQVVGPAGDVSYPDDGVPLDVCPAGSCAYSDPFIALGAEKHGYEGISYAGTFDELRISNTLRYTGNFDPPTAPFEPDASTVGLFHFDEGEGVAANDVSSMPTPGELIYGGDPAGPQWSTDSPW